MNGEGRWAGGGADGGVLIHLDLHQKAGIMRHSG